MILFASVQWWGSVQQKIRTVSHFFFLPPGWGCSSVAFSCFCQPKPSKEQDLPLPPLLLELMVSTEIPLHLAVAMRESRRWKSPLYSKVCLYFIYYFTILKKNIPYVPRFNHEKKSLLHCIFLQSLALKTFNVFWESLHFSSNRSWNFPSDNCFVYVMVILQIYRLNILKLKTLLSHDTGLCHPLSR